MFVVRWLILTWYFNEFVFCNKKINYSISKSIDSASKLRLILQNNYENRSSLRHKISSRQINPNFLSLGIFKNEIQNRFENLQLHLSNNDSDCFSGSFAYNGTCIYISSSGRKFTWFEAEKLCRELPFNTTFLTIQNNHQLEFLRKKIIQIKEKETPADQLVFLIGFNKLNNDWKWVTNKTVDFDGLKMENDWSESNYTLGDCGSLALTKNLKLILKSSPCRTTRNRFICQYTLNPCFNNDACGKNGRCVNLYQNFYCDCEQVSIFYTGKYCERLNSKAIQTIIAILMITFLFLYILLASKQTKKLFKYLVIKIEKKISATKLKTNEENSLKVLTVSKSVLSQTPSISRPIRSVSKIMRTRFRKFIAIFDSSIYAYTLLTLLIFVLTVAQIILIDYDNIDFINFKQTTKNNSLIISFICHKLESYFFIEEVFNLPFAGIFFILILLMTKKRRFSFYITKKFKNFPECLIDEVKNEKISMNAKERISFLFCCLSKNLKSCLILPNFSFSTTNRSQTAAVFILYTYDVLNIFTFIYTSSINPSIVPFTSKISGVLVDFLAQIFQVLFIGFKFYPILLVADSEPGIFIYLVTTCYISLIWSIRFLNKAFCSRTKILIQEILKQVVNNISDKIKLNIQYSYNISNIIFGIFSDDQYPNEKYGSMAKNIFSKIIKETFVNSEVPDYYIDESKRFLRIKRSFYAQIKESATKLNTNDSLRSVLKNETNYKTDQALYKLVNQSQERWYNFMENLPFYITISYLFTRYGLLFIACLIDKLKEYFDKRKLKNTKDENLLDVENLESVKNLNLLLDNPKTSSNKKQTSKQVSDEVKAKDLLAQNLYKIENFNYSYIRNLLVDNSQSYGNNSKKIIEKSFLLNFIDTYIYKNRPYLKFSKQFINTYTVSFMVVYFFTIFGFKITNILNDLIVECLKLIRQYIYGVNQNLSPINHDFEFELKFTFVLTSMITILQLLFGIKSFQRDLIKLHKAEFVFGRLITHFDLKKYMEIIKRRNKMSYSITSDSIHFTGYLIAHLVYGYFILFFGFFLIVLLIKLFLYFPNIIFSSSQILLPIVVMITLKLILVEFITKIFFLKNNNYRLKNSAPYNTCTYFNFFFDCFLGILACFSRVWLTSLMSLLTLIRLDISMFSKDNDFIMRRLDKGYLAYINFVRMEHWYNNPVVNGFCEMLIESMIKSKINRHKICDKANRELKVLSPINNTIKFSYQYDEDKKYQIFKGENLKNFKGKKANREFKYESYLRLRNLFYLVLLLKRFSFLRQHRLHRIEMLRKNLVSGKTESFFDSFDRQKRKFKRRRYSKLDFIRESNYENYSNIEDNLKKMMGNEHEANNDKLLLDVNDSTNIFAKNFKINQN